MADKGRGARGERAVVEHGGAAGANLGREAGGALGALDLHDRLERVDGHEEDAEEAGGGARRRPQRHGGRR